MAEIETSDYVDEQPPAEVEAIDEVEAVDINVTDDDKVLDTSFVAINGHSTPSVTQHEKGNGIELQPIPMTDDDEDKDNLNLLVTTKTINKTCSGDGSDSGIDFEATVVSVGAVQRALSSNSGGYTSSCGGIDDPAGGIQSCNSSMISFCSDMCDIKSVNTILRHNSNQDCTSEGGSESSSVTGGPICNRKSSMIRKKVALTEPIIVKTGRRDDNAVAKSRSRAASASRAAAQSTKSPVQSILTTKERARSRDKMTPTSSTAKQVPQTRSTPIKRPPKPDSLPNGIRDPASPAVQRVAHARTPSVPRGRTPGCTPTVEDGRWPSIGGKTNPGTPKTRAGSATPENLIIKTKVGPIVLDAKSSSSDKFATLPRRRKEKSDEDLRSKNYRSSSVQRDRMTTSLIKRQTSKESASTPSKPIQQPLQPTTRRAAAKTMPKTKIYHETSVQTALTCKDVQDALAGIASTVKEVEAIETCDRESQADIRDKEIERLHEQIRKMSTDYTKLQGTLSERSQLLHLTEQQLTREREEKQAMTKELQSNTERILGMLALVHHTQTPGDVEENCDSLLMLESQIQQSGHALEEKQCEIDKLYTFCKKLQLEMNRSINVQRNLLEEKEEIEKESTELQDFLQDEKTALVDALREAEVECDKSTELIKQKDVDIDRLQEECRHLVRISEQRR